MGIFLQINPDHIAIRLIPPSWSPRHDADPTLNQNNNEQQKRSL
jgi:hypothetical protein